MSTETQDDITALDAELDALDPAVTPAQDASDLRAIAQVVDQLNAGQEQLVAAVAAARANGKSWGHIAIPLGVSRQSARERFKDRI